MGSYQPPPLLALARCALVGDGEEDDTEGEDDAV